MGQVTLKEANDLIGTNKALLVAGAPEILEALPKGNWVAGSIPYFMSGDSGGKFSTDTVCVTDVSDVVEDLKIMTYDVHNLHNLTKDAFDNGFSFILLPAGSKVHLKYAMEACTFDDIFKNPVIGWVSGVKVENIGKDVPLVVNGELHNPLANEAVVMHAKIPDNKVARMEIVNIFSQDEHADELAFPQDGFAVTDCYVNGKRTNFAKYIQEKNLDTKLPLVADYSGAMINVSFQNVDQNRGEVTFFAPVFKNQTYKIAKHIEDYAGEFARKTPQNEKNILFSCNCILNYLYGELEGKKTGFEGPITFGEIGYVLLNQTLTYMVIEDRD